MRLSSNVRLASRTGAVLARILAIGVLATAAVGAQAQTPAVRPPGAGPGAGGPGGGRQMPPEMQAKMKAWRAYGEAHKNVGELGRKMGRIARMDKEKGLELSKPQAAKLVAILNTWHGKPAMTEPQAAQVQKQIMAILTQAQAKHVNQPGGAGPGGGGRMGRGGGPAMRGPGGGPGMSGPAVRPGPGGPAPAPAGAPRPGGPGGPGPGRMAGGGRMGGGGMGSGRRGGGMMNLPDPPKGGYNPLNPATNPMNARRPEAKKEMDTFLTDLQKRAKGK